MTAADLIVGTSAGSVVGSLIGHGVDLTEAVDRLAVEADPPGGSRADSAGADMDAVMTAFGILFDPNLEPRAARAQVGALALAAQVDASAVARLDELAKRMPSQEWPERRFLITAVDTADGAFVVWDGESGVPLPLAVTSSCAVP